MERRLSVLRRLVAGGVLLALLTGAGAWYLTRPLCYAGPEGYEIAVPRGWEVRRQGGALHLTGPGDPSQRSEGRAEFRPVSGPIEWPAAGIDLFGIRPDAYRTTQIDGRRAVLQVFAAGEHRFLAAAVDRGDGLILLRLGCPAARFEANRSLFERLARRIRCGRP